MAVSSPIHCSSLESDIRGDEVQLVGDICWLEGCWTGTLGVWKSVRGVSPGQLRLKSDTDLLRGGEIWVPSSLWTGCFTCVLTIW